MDCHHFVLIARQDSFARSFLPNVLAREDALSIDDNVFDVLLSLCEGKFDAVLIAIEEGDNDAAVQCRTIRRYTNLPIVMLVNPATRDQVTRGYRLGADAHIEIPCDARILRARLNALLRSQSLPTATEIKPIVA